MGWGGVRVCGWGVYFWKVNNFDQSANCIMVNFVNFLEKKKSLFFSIFFHIGFCWGYTHAFLRTPLLLMQFYNGSVFITSIWHATLFVALWLKLFRMMSLIAKYCLQLVWGNIKTILLACTISYNFTLLGEIRNYWNAQCDTFTCLYWCHPFS